jgi:hypothetical protein
MPSNFRRIFARRRRPRAVVTERSIGKNVARLLFGILRVLLLIKLKPDKEISVEILEFIMTTAFLTY